MGYEISFKISKKVIKEGIIFADGSEQTLILTNTTDVIDIEGYIDLSNMTIGDTVIIRRYIKVSPNEDYKLRGELMYTDVQKEPIVRIQSLPSKYGMKITLQQTKGTFKPFPYQFFKMG